MNKNDESWNQQNERLQQAQDAKNADKYGYSKEVFPIISLNLIKKIIYWFKKRK